MLDLTQAQSLKNSLLTMSRNGDLTLYKSAQERGISFSDILEELDPSSEESRKAGITAFDRQLLLFELAARPGESITVEHFFVKNAMLLLPEFIQREVSRGYQDFFNPSKLLAASIPEKGPTITPIYLKPTEAQKHQAKKGDAAEFARSVIAYREKPLAMTDRGRRFDFTYKVLRNQALAEFAVFCRYIGTSIAQDEIDELWTIGINGDGTSPAATQVFTGTAGTLAYNDLIHLAMSFNPPCNLTHILCRATDVEVILRLSQYQDPEIWRALQEIERSGRFTGLLPMNAQLVIAPNATTKVLLGIDSRWAFRETFAQPLMIEADKIITQKLEYMVISKESCYSVMVDGALLKCDYT